LCNFDIANQDFLVTNFDLFRCDRVWLYMEDVDGSNNAIIYYYDKKICSLYCL